MLSVRKRVRLPTNTRPTLNPLFLKQYLPCATVVQKRILALGLERLVNQDKISKWSKGSMALGKNGIVDCLDVKIAEQEHGTRYQGKSRSLFKSLETF